MGRYIARRLLISIPVLIGVTLVVYFMIDLAPGDPVAAMVSPTAGVGYGKEWMEQKRESLGLNKPWAVRYALWLQEVARGNLGYSLVSKKPVAQEIQRLLTERLEDMERDIKRIKMLI